MELSMIKLITRLHYLLIVFIVVNAHAQSKGPFFNVLDYDASNDGTNRATKGINAAIHPISVDMFAPFGDPLKNELAARPGKGYRLCRPAGARRPFTRGAHYQCVARSSEPGR